MQIAPCQTSASALHPQTELLIVLSSNAAQHGKALLKQAAIQQVPILAIGNKTAASITAHTLPILSSTNASSEGVLLTIQKQFAYVKNVAILAGESGRTTIADTLGTMGVDVYFRRKGPKE